MMLNKGELDGNRVLARKTVELMTQNHHFSQGRPASHANGLGFGFEIILEVAQNQLLGSRGMFWAGGSAGTYVWIDPEEDLIGIFLPQFQPYNQNMMRKFQVLVYQALIE